MRPVGRQVEREAAGGCSGSAASGPQVGAAAGSARRPTYFANLRWIVNCETVGEWAMGWPDRATIAEACMRRAVVVI